MNWWRNLIRGKSDGMNEKNSVTGAVSPNNKRQHELSTARTTAKEESRPTPPQPANSVSMSSPSSDKSVRVMLPDGRVKDFKAPKTASQLADFLGDVLNS